ncbi:hypothetical protein L3Q67_35260 [Saccharothrix sp. AJ9571]|nr:hypothetical protein L3Q67_35260 [Saccharothrix sp. AJ9571]
MRDLLRVAQRFLLHPVGGGGFAVDLGLLEGCPVGTRPKVPLGARQALPRTVQRGLREFDLLGTAGDASPAVLVQPPLTVHQCFFAGIGDRLPFIREPLAVILGFFPPIRQLLPFIGCPVPLIGLEITFSESRFPAGQRAVVASSRLLPPSTRLLLATGHDAHRRSRAQDLLATPAHVSKPGRSCRGSPAPADLHLRQVRQPHSSCGGNLCRAG